ncbi:hypothetical protein AKO1_005798, partial [Acrasis kona]
MAYLIISQPPLDILISIMRTVSTFKLLSSVFTSDILSIEKQYTKYYTCKKKGLPMLKLKKRVTMAGIILTK